MDTRGSGPITEETAIKEEVRRRKIRKFAYKEQSDNQTDGSKTETTLILCGYSRERANNRGDSTTERRMRRRKMRKFASRHTKNNHASKQAHVSNTETTLILYGYSRERANKRVRGKSVYIIFRRGKHKSDFFYYMQFSCKEFFKTKSSMTIFNR